MDPSDERLRHPEDWVGEQIHGKWRVDELLGLGGVASVYSATDRLGNQVALKIMHGYWVDEPSVCERFLREGYSANRVKHPAVITALADGITDGGTPFLVLELLEGRSLEAELLINGILPPHRVLDIADQILDGLAAAHAINVIHRDLKPDNLFLMYDDSVRILDFGIARMHDTTNQRLTVNGRAMGTPGYMSPEQARGEWDNIDARTDIWSLGATMYALLSGHEVHEGLGQQELLVASMTRPVEPIRDVDPTVSRRIANIVDKAVAFDRETRYASARDMQRAVRKAMKHIDADTIDGPATLRPVTTNPLPEKTAPRKNSMWRVAIVAAACVASVAAVGSDIHDRTTPKSTLNLGVAAALPPPDAYVIEEPAPIVDVEVEVEQVQERVDAADDIIDLDE